MPTSNNNKNAYNTYFPGNETNGCTFLWHYLEITALLIWSEAERFEEWPSFSRHATTIRSVAPDRQSKIFPDTKRDKTAFSFAVEPEYSNFLFSWLFLLVIQLFWFISRLMSVWLPKSIRSLLRLLSEVILYYLQVI